jgi:hypothetical protein
MALANSTCPVCKLLVIVDTAQPGRCLNPQADLRKHPSALHICPGSFPESAFPYAIDADTVYYVDARMTRESKMSAKAPTGPVLAPLKPYTDAISKERRRRAESRLGEIALTRPALTAGAVSTVTNGIREYLNETRKTQDKDVLKQVGACMSKYMFSATGFGRLGQPKDRDQYKDDAALYELCLETLAHGNLPSVMGIQDFMGRIVFKALSGNRVQVAIHKNTGNLVRPAYLFGEPEVPPPPRKEPTTKEEEELERKDKEAKEAETNRKLRGRVKAPERPEPTQIIGIMPKNSPPSRDMQKRERGIDLWQMVEDGGPTCNVNIHQRNLIFGAGPSGSTGTLLQAGKLFGNLDGELLKQYVLAIVGYLVGGGMHSLHEVLQVCAMIGCPYKAGAIEPTMPRTFLQAQEGRAFIEQYYDIAVLGARLWTLRPAQAAVSRLDQNRIAELEKTLKFQPAK